MISIQFWRSVSRMLTVYKLEMQNRGPHVSSTFAQPVRDGQPMLWSQCLTNDSRETPPQGRPCLFHGFSPAAHLPPQVEGFRWISAAPNRDEIRNVSSLITSNRPGLKRRSAGVARIIQSLRRHKIVLLDFIKQCLVTYLKIARCGLSVPSGFLQSSCDGCGLSATLQVPHKNFQPP